MESVRQNGSGGAARAWPDFPMEAQLALRRQIGYQSMDAMKTETICVEDFLAHKDACSFVLPPSGRLLPPETPAVLSTDIVVPAERFILEFGSNDRPPQEQPITLLLVRHCAARRELAVMALFRVEGEEPPCWASGMTDFVLGDQERIEFSAREARLIARDPCSRTQRLALAIENGGGLYRTLAHFLMVYNAPNVAPVKVEAPHRTPGHYYTLRLDGRPKLPV